MIIHRLLFEQKKNPEGIPEEVWKAGITMDWLLQFPEAKKVYDSIFIPQIELKDGYSLRGSYFLSPPPTQEVYLWNNRAARTLMMKYIDDPDYLLYKKLREKGNVSSEDLENEPRYIGPGMNTYQLNFKPFGYTELAMNGLNDLTACFGRFEFKINGNFTVTYTGEKGGMFNRGYRVTIKELGIYVMDSFDFEGFNQPLGCWAYPDYCSLIPTYTTLNLFNSDFIAWKNRVGNDYGGDFKLYTDMKVFSINNPKSYLL